MNQSFSTENFVKIFYDENRKGNYIEGAFSIFEPLQNISKSIKKINQNFKSKFYTTDEKREQANKCKDLLREKKFIKLGSILEDVELKICKKNYSIDLTTAVVKNKTVYSVCRTNPEVFFLLKQLQRNIQYSFKIKQADRYEVVNQVINMLDNNFPKYIIRTDIRSFFESIPHDKLKNKINQNYILSSESKKIINNILTKYKNIVGHQEGIPRGIGISAYLSELYMREIDDKIKKLPNLTYYARYVDDMILIFTPDTKYDKNDYLNILNNIVAQDNLVLNTKKTSEFNLVNFDTKKNYNFDFLGFNLQFNNYKTNDNKIIVDLSHRKKRKYIKKIQYMIDDYNINSKYNEKKSRKLFIQRLKYLTGNIRLLNVKQDILVGIYFSNILLSKNINYLEKLDGYLHAMINKKLIPYIKLTYINTIDFKENLKKYTFEEGFEKKKFYKFNKDELEEILKVWKTL